jgi:hypothetical protein
VANKKRPPGRFLFGKDTMLWHYQFCTVEQFLKFGLDGTTAHPNRRAVHQQ